MFFFHFTITKENEELEFFFAWKSELKSNTQILELQFFHAKFKLLSLLLLL